MYNSPVPQKLSEELREMILQTEDLIYPWNPTEPEVDSYWTDVDETLSLFDDLPENELSDQAEQFFSHLHERWQNIDDQNVEELFVKKYRSLLPAQWLESLIERAKLLVIEQEMESLERLVVCVKPLLENWSDEDLQVLAQPLIGSMGETQDIKEIAWEERPEIDQGRLILVIAQEILMRFEESQAVRE